MATVNIILDDRRSNKEGKFPLRLRITHKRKMRHIPLGYSCARSQWNGNGLRNYPNSGIINTFLSKKLADARTAVIERADDLEYMTIDEIKALVENYDPEGRKKRSTIMLKDWSDTLIDRLIKAGRNGTADWYKNSRNAILKFHGKDLSLRDIDIRLLKEFEADYIGKGRSYNGLSSIYRGLRAIINQANTEHPNCDLHPFKNYKIKETKTPKRAVKANVINDIRQLKTTKKGGKDKLADWHAKNYLLFMFNMRGMNFIDVAKLKKEQLIETKYKNGKLTEGRLTYIRSKNNKEFSIKLTNESIDILNAYDIADKEKDEFIFPIGYENTTKGRQTYKQKRKRYNSRFTKLAKEAGHDIEVTSYVIRHSWASIAKYRGVSKDLIGESLGHEDPKVTEVYLESFENKALDDMNEIVVG